MFTIKLFSTAENYMEVNYLTKKVYFSFVGNYLRPSNNSNFNINAVVLIVITC